MDKDNFEYVSVDDIKDYGPNDRYSIQVNEKDFYKNTPNFIANNFVSKNSKHACIRKNQKVLTNTGYVEIGKLRKPTKIAYLNKNNEICLTKRYDIHRVGIKDIYKLETESGLSIEVTNDHEFFVENKRGKIKKKKLKNIRKGDKIVVF